MLEEFIWEQDNFKTSKDILLNGDALFADNLLLTNHAKFSAAMLENDIIPTINKAKQVDLSNSKIYAHPITDFQITVIQNSDIKNSDQTINRKKLDDAFNKVCKASAFKIDLFKQEHIKTAEKISNKINIPASIFINSIFPMVGANDIKNLTKAVDLKKNSVQFPLKRKMNSSTDLVNYINKKTQLFYSK
jgi:hypothetical protein